MQAYQPGRHEQSHQYSTQSKQQGPRTQSLGIGEYTDPDKLLILNRINASLTRLDPLGREKYLAQDPIKTTLASCRVEKCTEEAIKDRISKLARPLSPQSSPPPSGQTRSVYQLDYDKRMEGMKAFEAKLFDPKSSSITKEEWARLVGGDSLLHDLVRVHDLNITDRSSALKLHKQYVELLGEIVDSEEFMEAPPLISASNNAFRDFHTELMGLKQSPGALYLFLTCLPTIEKNPELSLGQIANAYRGIDGWAALYSAGIPFQEPKDASKGALESAIRATGKNIETKRADLKTKLEPKMDEPWVNFDNLDLVQAIHLVNKYSKEGGLSKDPNTLHNQLMALEKISERFTDNHSYIDRIVSDHRDYQDETSSGKTAPAWEANPKNVKRMETALGIIKREITKAHPALAAFMAIETM